VELAAAGPLGLKFRDEGRRGLTVESVKAGTQAAEHAALMPGLRLLTLVLADGRGYSADTLGYAGVLGLLRAATRPLTLRFKDQSFLPAAPVTRPKPLVSAIFTEVGTLGLKFKPLELATNIGLQLTGINEATQAAAHAELAAGMVLASVESGGDRRAGLEDVAFEAAVAVLREAGRPVTLTFAHGVLPAPTALQARPSDTRLILN
jgi:hypothetical protein